MPREKIKRQQIDLSDISKKSDKDIREQQISADFFDDKPRTKNNNNWNKMDNRDIESDDVFDEEDFFDKEFQFVDDDEANTNKQKDITKSARHQERTVKKESARTEAVKKKPATDEFHSGTKRALEHKYDDKSGKATAKTKKKRVSPWVVLGIFTIFLLAVVGCVYGAGAHYYSTHFLRGTIINGIDVSNMTYDELTTTLKDYSIVVKERGKTANSQYVEKIKGDEIGIDLVSGSGVEDILKNQSLLKWYAPSGEIYEKDVLISFDEQLLEERVLKLKGFQDGQFEKPQNATVSDYDSQKGFSIVPETQGNTLKKKVAIQAIKDAVTNLEREIDLDKKDCYMKPKIDSGNKKLNDRLNQMNKLAEVEITYTFGETIETVDGSLISQWLVTDEETNKVSVDREQVGEYVATLRKKYDTIFRKRDFKTRSGKTVTLDNGDYGWWMNYVEETKQLADQIEEGTSGKRTPVYYQTAAQYGPKDYGNTYVEINLTSQKLFVIVDGKQKLKTDVCTGNTSRGHGTNPGIFGITYKERYGVLVGETYESTVAYWMPFDGDIGLHDAIWKTQFGSDFYKTDGSHGCVNLPYNTAKKIYGLVEKNTPVIVYELPGTESDSVTVQSYKEIANAAIEAIDAIGTVDKDSGDEIETARYMYNKVGAAGQKYVKNYDVLLAAEAEFKSLSQKN